MGFSASRSFALPGAAASLATLVARSISSRRLAFSIGVLFESELCAGLDREKGEITNPLDRGLSL
jgi:hypothetical protein